jgi:transcriptional regulator with XRE-family HTH domain
MLTSAAIMDAVQERMTNLGLTQGAVAAEAGIDQAHLSKILSGRIKEPRLNTLLKVCDAVGISVHFTTPKAAK